MGLPDIVYLVKESDRNDQLRYSLRSLTNLPHRHVWLAGHKPPFVSDVVGHIPTVQGRLKHPNQALNLRAACECPDVSDPFVMFNDDFYVTAPIDRVPVLHRGLLANLVSGGRSEHVKRLRETSEYLGPEALGYDRIHVPMTFDKTGMLAVLDEIGDRMLFRSVYGNRFRVGGRVHPNVKIGEQDKPDLPPPFVSTSGGAFAQRQVGRRLRHQFPAPCRYEQ